MNSNNTIKLIHRIENINDRDLNKRYYDTDINGYMRLPLIISLLFQDEFFFRKELQESEEVSESDSIIYKNKVYTKVKGSIISDTLNKKWFISRVKAVSGVNINLKNARSKQDIFNLSWGTITGAVRLTKIRKLINTGKIEITDDIMKIASDILSIIFSNTIYREYILYERQTIIRETDISRYSVDRILKALELLDVILDTLLHSVKGWRVKVKKINDKITDQDYLSLISTYKDLEDTVKLLFHNIKIESRLENIVEYLDFYLAYDSSWDRFMHRLLSIENKDLIYELMDLKLNTDDIIERALIVLISKAVREFEDSKKLYQEVERTANLEGLKQLRTIGRNRIDTVMGGTLFRNSNPANTILTEVYTTTTHVKRFDLYDMDRNNSEYIFSLAKDILNYKDNKEYVKINLSENFTEIEVRIPSSKTEMPSRNYDYYTYKVYKIIYRIINKKLDLNNVAIIVETNRYEVLDSDIMKDILIIIEDSNISNILSWEEVG